MASLCAAWLHKRRVSPAATGVWLVVFGLAVLLRFTEGSWVVLTATFMVFAAWLGGFDCRRLFLAALYALAAGIFMVVLLAGFDVIPKGFIGAGTDRLRSSFGFQWPSRLPNFLLTITMIYVCTTKRRLPVRSALICLGLATLVYCDSNSRAPFLCTAAVLLVVLLCQRVPMPRGRWVPWACLGFLGIVVAGTFWLAATYDPSVPWMASLNSAMSNRLLYSHNAFVSTGIMPFGSPLFSGESIDPRGVGYLDAGYLSLFFSDGWVFGCLWLACFAALLFWAARTKAWSVLVCLLLVAAQGAMESKVLALQYTPFLLLFPDAISWVWKSLGHRGDSSLENPPLAQHAEAGECKERQPHYPAYGPQHLKGIDEDAGQDNDS